MSRSHSAAIPLTTKPSDVVALHPAILQWALATAIALTVGIAGASFWLSFAVLRDLAVRAGIGPGEAWVIPVVLDGAIVSTTVTAIALSNHTDNRTIKGRRFVVTILRVAASASIAGNPYHAVLSATLLPAVVSAGIATIAPIALLAMTEVLPSYFVRLAEPSEWNSLQVLPQRSGTGQTPTSATKAPAQAGITQRAKTARGENTSTRRTRLDCK